MAGIRVTPRDIASLDPGEWLTDNIFEVFVGLMMQSLAVAIKASGARIGLTTSIVFTTIHACPENLDAVNYMRNIRLTELDIWLIPIVHNGHFSLFVVYKPNTLAAADGTWVTPGDHECKVLNAHIYFIFYILCTLCSLYYACTIYYVLCSVYCVPCTVYYALYTMYHTLYIL
jgi:hypothetical protein